MHRWFWMILALRVKIDERNRISRWSEQASQISQNVFTNSFRFWDDIQHSQIMFTRNISLDNCVTISFKRKHFIFYYFFVCSFRQFTSYFWCLRNKIGGGKKRLGWYSVMTIWKRCWNICSWNILMVVWKSVEKQLWHLNENDDLWTKITAELKTKNHFHWMMVVRYERDTFLLSEHALTAFNSVWTETIL